MYTEGVPNRNSLPAILLHAGWREDKEILKRTLANLSRWPAEKIQTLRRLLRDATLVSPEDLFTTRQTLPYGHPARRDHPGNHPKARPGFIIAAKRCPERDLVVAMIVEQLLPNSEVRVGTMCILRGTASAAADAPTPGPAPFCSSGIGVERTSNQVTRLERRLPTFEFGLIYPGSKLATPRAVQYEDALRMVIVGVRTVGGLDGGFRCGHVALAVEEASGIDDEAGRVNVSQDNAVLFDLQALGGVDGTFYFSRNADFAGVDIAIHFTFIVDHDRAFTRNLTVDVRVDADQAGRDLYLSVNLHARL